MKFSNYDIKNIYEWPFFIKIFLFSLIAFMIFYFGYLLDTNNLRKYINNSKKQQYDLLNQFQAALYDRMKIEQEISQLPVLNQTLQTWEKKLVMGTKIHAVLDELIKMGSQSQVQLNLLDPLPEVKDKFYSKIPVKIKLSGSFDEIASFLSYIANMEIIAIIGDFTITHEKINAAAEQKMTTNNSHSLELILDIYMKPVII